MSVQYHTIDDNALEGPIPKPPAQEPSIATHDNLDTGARRRVATGW